MTLYYSNLLNYSSSLAGFVVGGRAPISILGPLAVDDPAILDLIKLTSEATHYQHCLDYYCDQNPLPREIVRESNNVCTESDSITGITSFASEDPTVMSLVAHKVQERMYVYSSLPVAEQEDDQIQHDPIYYEYIVLHRKARNNAVPAVSITIPTSSECTNVTIASKVDIVVYRARNRDEYVNVSIANTPIKVSCLLRFEVVWIEPVIDTCHPHAQAPTLRGMVIKSTIEVAVYVGEAECNVTQAGDRGFGYVANIIHALPPAKRWGKTFIIDLGHLGRNLTLHKQELVALFHIVSDAAETTEELSVEVTTYTPEERASMNSSKYTLEPYQPMTIEVHETYIHVIQSSIPILVVYEVYNEVTGERYFSTLLQAAEWFASQQSILLSHSLIPQLQQYYITLVIKTNLESYDPTNLQIQTAHHERAVSFLEYAPFKSGNIISYPVGNSDYTIVTVAVNSEALGDNDTCIVIKSVDACTEFGATVVSYGENSSYAHTNAYVIGEYSSARVD